MSVLAGKSIDSICFEICIADLRNRCTVETRAIQNPKFGNSEASEAFIVIHNAYFWIQTMGGARGQGTKRWSGIAITEAITHLFVCQFRSVIKDIDGGGGHFIKKGNTYYRIEEITNINEDNRYVLFQCSERGDVVKEETHA